MPYQLRICPQLSTTQTIVISSSMFESEVTLARGKLSFFSLFVFFLSFWVVVEFFSWFFFCMFFVALFLCFALLSLCFWSCKFVFYIYFFVFLFFFFFFFASFFLCFCKFFVCIYFTTISRFQFASSLNSVKDLTLHMSLATRSQSCLKEGKLHKSKVCP